MGTDDMNVASPVRTAETMFDIVEYVRDNDGATVTEVAADLEYAKSTAHRHLRTLHRLGYIVEEPDGYHLGLRFLNLGHHAQNRRKAYQLAQEKADQLAESTGERAQFIVEESGQAVFLYRALGESAVRTDPGIGSRIPLHATSAGKAILATLPEDRLFEIVEQTSPLKSITEATITDSDELLTELEAIRERGYSFNDQENLDGLRAVGVPVQDPNGGVIGALSVSGPSYRLEGTWYKEELPSLLLGIANELELNIAHS